MAKDRNPSDEWYSGPGRDRDTEMNEERVRGGDPENIRGVADQDEDEEFEDTEELDEDEDTDTAM